MPDGRLIYVSKEQRDRIEDLRVLYDGNLVIRAELQALDALLDAWDADPRQEEHAERVRRGDFGGLPSSDETTG